MRNPKWAEMKALNKRLRCTGDNKERRYFTEPSMVSHESTVEDLPRKSRHYLTQQEAARRYERREEMRSPMYGRNPFREGMVTRPQKGRTKNAYSREEAGTMGTQMTTRRFSGSYITVYCKSKKQY